MTGIELRKTAKRFAATGKEKAIRRNRAKHFGCRSCGITKVVPLLKVTDFYQTY